MRATNSKFFPPFAWESRRCAPLSQPRKGISLSARHRTFIALDRRDELGAGAGKTLSASMKLESQRKAQPPASRCIALPYHISTLLYCFNRTDQVLLLERAQEPNIGLWSPCGGKLDTAVGESPYRCACREASEELGLTISAADLHLTG